MLCAEVIYCCLSCNYCYNCVINVTNFHVKAQNDTSKIANITGTVLNRDQVIILGWRGGLVVERRTCDLVVAGSRPSRDAAA